MNTNNSYKNDSVIIEDVPYTVSDVGTTKSQSPVDSHTNSKTTTNTAQNYNTYNFSTPNGYGFIRTFQFTSSPVAGLNLSGIGESLSSLSSLLLPIMLLSVLKLLSGATSLLGPTPTEASQNRQDTNIKTKP